jgi:hypothetical protein
MKTLEQLTLSEARNSDRKAFVKWTDVCAGSRRTLTEEVTTVGHLLDLIEAASNDPTREAVERRREARTGIARDENWTSAQYAEAEETLGDNIRALNGGDDDVSVFDIPEFNELLEQFHGDKFNANTFPTSEQVSEILCDLWTEDDGTVMECDAIQGNLHHWEISDELPDGPEWKEKLRARLGFDQFREPANICRGGNGDVIWFLEKTDKEVSEILDAIREEAEETKA